MDQLPHGRLFLKFGFPVPATEDDVGERQKKIAIQQARTGQM